MCGCVWNLPMAEFETRAAHRGLGAGHGNAGVARVDCPGSKVGLSMYQFFRQVHLFTGLLLLVFVLMYFFTGYVMIHGKWFGPNEPKTSVETNSFPLVANESDADLARRLQRQFGLSG